MRYPRRAAQYALALVSVGVLGTSAPASAAETLKAYEATVERSTVSVLSDFGVDIGHTGFDQRKLAPQRIIVDLLPSQAAAVEQRGLDLTEVNAITVAPRKAMEAAAKSSRARRAIVKPDTGGDSPNAFYDVYRTYMEEGGIADELRELAADNPGYAKLVQIGVSQLGKPILALKVTKDARNVRDGERPAVLYSGVNHAREWIAAETARRMPRWFLDHKDSGKTKALLERSELWFLPIMNPDGYDYTFTCGAGATNPTTNRPCGSQLNPATGTYQYVDIDGTVQASNNRLWRKTLRNNNNNDAVIGDGNDGVDPPRSRPAGRSSRAVRSSGRR